MENQQFGELDLSNEELQKALFDAVRLVVDLYRGIDQRRVMPEKHLQGIRALFDEPLPESPMEISSVLKRVETEVFENSTMSVGPNYYGFINSGGNHAGLIAEFLSAAIDQNVAKWTLGPAATELELCVIRWIAEFLGYPAGTGGVLVSGGSAANLTCLKVARDHQSRNEIQRKGIRSSRQQTMYVSVEGHSCLDKSIDELGIGRDYLRKIPVTADFTVDLGELERKIVEDREAGLQPACIIGNAGTVNTGAVDPMHPLADLARKYSMWFHVDAAYGGPAAMTAPGMALFDGIERADSVGADAHKWLYAPFESGIALVKEKELLRTSYSLVHDYLRENENNGRYDATEFNFQLSRNFKALKLWMAFKAYGSKALRRAIEENIRTMHHLARLIDASEDFELLAPAPLSIVCFRYRTDDRALWGDSGHLSNLNKRMLIEIENDGRVFLSGTLINGEQALRACSVNHRTKTRHVEFLLTVLREIGRSVHSTIVQGSKTATM